MLVASIPNYDNQKNVPQTLPNVHEGTKLTLAENHPIQSCLRLQTKEQVETLSVIVNGLIAFQV